MSETKAIFPPKNQPKQDCVMTPQVLARRCVQVLEPHGYCWEPCAGDGAFVDALDGALGVTVVGWCEIDPARKYFQGTNDDFLTREFRGPVSFILTNPPFSKYLQFAEKCFEVADNVAFLAPIERAFRLSVMRRAKASGHGIKAIWTVPWPVEWKRGKTLGGYGINAPDMLFGLTHWERGYSGPIAFAELPELEESP